MAVGPSAGMVPDTAPSRASPLPQWIAVERRFCVHRRSTVGAGLARDSGGSSARMATDTAPSRASSRPQGIVFVTVDSNDHLPNNGNVALSGAGRCGFTDVPNVLPIRVLVAAGVASPS